MGKSLIVFLLMTGHNVVEGKERVEDLIIDTVIGKGGSEGPGDYCEKNMVYINRTSLW